METGPRWTKAYLVLLQLPDAEGQHSYQKEAVKNQNQRADPPSPLCPRARHDGSGVLRGSYRDTLETHTAGDQHIWTHLGKGLKIRQCLKLVKKYLRKRNL